MIMMIHNGYLVTLTHRQCALYDKGKPVIAKVMGLTPMRIQKEKIHEC